jgi:hypothetical protein
LASSSAGHAGDSPERTRLRLTPVVREGCPDGKAYGRNVHDSPERARLRLALVVREGCPDGKVYGRNGHDSPVFTRNASSKTWTAIKAQAGTIRK